jgi:hypothetical protein
MKKLKKVLILLQKNWNLLMYIIGLVVEHFWDGTVIVELSRK